MASVPGYLLRGHHGISARCAAVEGMDRAVAAETSWGAILIGRATSRVLRSSVSAPALCCRGAGAARSTWRAETHRHDEHVRKPAWPSRLGTAPPLRRRRGRGSSARRARHAKRCPLPTEGTWPANAGDCHGAVRQLPPPSRAPGEHAGAVCPRHVPARVTRAARAGVATSSPAAPAPVADRRRQAVGRTPSTTAPSRRQPPITHVGVEAGRGAHRAVGEDGECLGAGALDEIERMGRAPHEDRLGQDLREPGLAGDDGHQLEVGVGGFAGERVDQVVAQHAVLSPPAQQRRRGRHRTVGHADEGEWLRRVGVLDGDGPPRLTLGSAADPDVPTDVDAHRACTGGPQLGGARGPRPGPCRCRRDRTRCRPGT